MEDFHRAILSGVRDGYSDLHITGGHPLVYRRHGVVDFDKDFRWTHTEIDALVKRLLTPQELDLLRKRLSVDVARTIKNIRVRINVFVTTRGLSLAMRLLPGRPPSIDNLNLHPSLKQYCRLSSGLILICGSTGSGKSTTIAGMLEEINNTRAAHIITLEDPIEYRFLSKKSFIEQRELRSHIPSFDQGLLDVLREDPDVIVVGEIREPETIKLTLNAVEAGHLVIASLHATNSEDALYRIGNSFPPDAQDIVRSQLASTLALLVVQKLIQPERLGFRVPLLSMLRGNNSVRGIIRENRLHQIESTMQTGRSEGMVTMEQYQRDYLDTRKDFTSPDISFRATEEASNELLYQTPILLDGLSREPGPARAAAGSATRATAPRSGLDGDPFYIIEDAAPMDEVLTELNSRRDQAGQGRLTRIAWGGRRGRAASQVGIILVVGCVLQAQPPGGRRIAEQVGLTWGLGPPDPVTLAVNDIHSDFQLTPASVTVKVTRIKSLSAATRPARWAVADPDAGQMASHFCFSVRRRNQWDSRGNSRNSR